MMKMLFRIASVLVLVGMLAFGFTPARPTYAQAGLTWTSGFQVYNPSPDTDATVTFYFYNQSDGSLAVNPPPTDTIPHGQSATYFPISYVTAGFQGSLEIQSNVALATINNLVTPTFSYTASTTGFTQGSLTVNIPLIACNNSGFNSFFTVQNVDTVNAAITIAYTPAPGSPGATGVTETANLLPGQSKTFDQGPSSTTKNCIQLGSGPLNKFVGGATITSVGGNIVASSYLINTTTFTTLSGFNAFIGGSPTAVIPLVMSQNSGFYTGMQIQNVGSAQTTVTITYSTNSISGSTFTPTPETCVLNAGQSCNKIEQANGQWTNPAHKYIGSATLTTSPATNIVAIGNQVGIIGPKKVGDGFDAVDPSTATQTIDEPLIAGNNSGWYTGVQVMNVGTGTCTTVTMTYGPNKPGWSFAPVPETANNLAVGTSKNWNEGYPVGQFSNNNWSNLANKYLGAATVVGTGTGCAIVAVVNQYSAATNGDTLMTYNAFNR